MHIFRRADDLLGADAEFGPDPVAPRRPCLRTRHANEIVINHGIGQMLGSLDGEGEAVIRSTGRCVARMKIGQARKIFLAIGGILEVHHLFQAEECHVVRLLRQRCAQRLQERIGSSVGEPFGKFRRSGGRRRFGGRRAVHGPIEGGVESGEAGLNAFAALADDPLKGLARERQCRRGRQRPEQSGRNHAAVIDSHRVHVEDDLAARGDMHGVGDRAVVGDAFAGRHLFGHGQGAVARGDQHRPVRRDDAAQDGASSLHVFGGDDDIDIAGRRHLRQDRPPAAETGGHHLDVIDGRAGSLGDARHRGRLRDPTLILGERHDPIGQYTAALSAHGDDGDGDRPFARPAGRFEIELDGFVPDHVMPRNRWPGDPAGVAGRRSPARPAFPSTGPSASDCG